MEGKFKGGSENYVLVLIKSVFLVEGLYSPWFEFLVEMVKMEETVVKELDPQGRVSIPAQWRKKWKSRMLVLIRYGDRIEMLPITSISPSELFDRIKVTGDVNFADAHSLKKAVLELHEA